MSFLFPWGGRGLLPFPPFKLPCPSSFCFLRIFSSLNPFFFSLSLLSYTDLSVHCKGQESPTGRTGLHRAFGCVSRTKTEETTPWCSWGSRITPIHLASSLSGTLHCLGLRVTDHGSWITPGKPSSSSVALFFGTCTLTSGPVSVHHGPGGIHW